MDEAATAAAVNPQSWPCETVTAITEALEGGSS